MNRYTIAFCKEIRKNGTKTTTAEGNFHRSRRNNALSYGEHRTPEAGNEQHQPVVRDIQVIGKCKDGIEDGGRPAGNSHVAQRNQFQLQLPGFRRYPGNNIFRCLTIQLSVSSSQPFLRQSLNEQGTIQWLLLHADLVHRSRPLLFHVGLTYLVNNRKSALPRKQIFCDVQSNVITGWIWI